MKILVLWEDQRAVGREFGPDLLLKSCIADDRNDPRYVSHWWKRIEPLPKKGKEKVLAALQKDLEDLAQDGPVVAVLDHDRAHELCGLRRKPVCKSELLKSIRQKAPGKYELILLEQNLEFLLLACCEALGRSPSRAKPKRDERDDILREIAFHQERAKRELVREKVRSFDRLVRKVGERIAGLIH